MIDAATILVAEDSSDDVELLKRAMQKAGLKNPVHYLNDGKEVIDYLSEGENSENSEAAHPLLMFLDLNMPRCTGFAVLEWLRHQPQLRTLPTIVFSNSDQESDIARSLQLGAKSYWIKPSRFEELVQMMVRLKEMVARAAQTVEAECPVPVDEPLLA